MNPPVITVVLATYCRNRPGDGVPNLLRRAIDSILNQTFLDLELILIDDASQDGSQKICQEYADRDPRVRYIRNAVNTAIPAKNYNEGVRLSKGKYVAFMFDDDLWYPSALYLLLQQMELPHHQDPKVAGIYGQCHLRAENRGPTVALFGGPFSKEKARTTTQFGNLAVLLKRDIFKTVGGQDETKEMRRLCDMEQWHRISLKYDLKMVNVLVGEAVTNQPGSIGRTIPLDQKALRAAIDSPERPLPLKGENY